MKMFSFFFHYYCLSSPLNGKLLMAFFLLGVAAVPSWLFFRICRRAKKKVSQLGPCNAIQYHVLDNDGGYQAHPRGLGGATH